MASEDWTIPPELRPDPADYRFDLERALASVVALRARTPDDAFTANSLGTEREGSGVVIRPDGLVLTIGYLVTEAEEVWITTRSGRVVPGHALAVDFATGFGLVQALGALDLPVLELDAAAGGGESEGPAVGTQVVLASSGGRASALACSVAARGPFAGYWEYLIDNAIFTAPAHPHWGGAALIGGEGRLLGIGSLVMQHRDQRGRRVDLNMVVPVGGAAQVLDEMLTMGRANRPPRPWLGLYAADQDEGLSIASLAPGGPAEQAGLQPGDRILAVSGTDVAELADLWRAVWATGEAGAEVPLTLLRGKRRLQVAIASADRARFLKAPRLH
jgi:S1-C subfamily serine protease